MAGFTQSLQVAGVVWTTLMQWDDVVDLQIVFRIRLSTFQTGEFIACQGLQSLWTSSFSSVLGQFSVCPRWGLAGYLDGFGFWHFLTACER